MSKLGHFVPVLLALAAGLLPGPASAAQPFGGPFGGEAMSQGAAPQIAVRTVWQQPQAHPGDEVVLAVVLDIPDRLHINPNAAQLATGLDFKPYPTRLDVTQAPLEVVTFEAARFPAPHPVEADYARGLTAYEGRTIFYLAGKVAPTAQPGAYAITLALEYQACDERNCFRPELRTLPVTLDVIAAGAAVQAAQAQADATLFAEFAQAGNQIAFDLFGWRFTVDGSTAIGAGLVMLLALLGGFLLNLTPCVLPVIPLKIMGLSQSAANRTRTFVLGAVMSLGVVAFWLGIGGAIVLSRRVITGNGGFNASNQLFQYPIFTVTVGLIIAAMAVGMCGLFAVRLPQFVYRINPRHDSVAGSFGFGIMTAVLSTPCTAPFMGAAAAWAVTQNPGITFATFASVGVGMALPYLVLSANPQLVDRMPRTGPASELIKQVMGLLMLAAAAFFIGTGLSGRFTDPPTTLYWWPVMAFIAAAGAWLIYRTVQITSAPSRRAIFGSLGILFIAGAVYGGIRFTDKGPIDWVYYSPQRFAQAQQRGEVIVLDFTAEWCLNCKALEHGVLYPAAVSSVLNSEGVVAMKVDITGDNPDGRQKLRELDRLMIPYLVIYAPDGRAVFKSDAYTSQQVIEAIREARPSASPSL